MPRIYIRTYNLRNRSGIYTIIILIVISWLVLDSDYQKIIRRANLYTGPSVLFTSYFIAVLRISLRCGLSIRHYKCDSIINRSRITVGLVIKSNFILRSILLPKITAACIFLVLSSVFVVLKPLFYWFKTTWHFPTLLVISPENILLCFSHCCLVQPISYLWALCYTLPKYALTWGLYR